MMVETRTRTSGTYLIPQENLAQLESRIADLNKRCKRLGIEPITMRKEHERREHEWASINNRHHTRWSEGQPLKGAWQETGRIRDWYQVTVEGDEPKFEGWTLTATLEPIKLDDGWENIVMAVPGQDVPEEYRSRVGQCDHCNAKRYRKETFIVRHEDGEYKMVGRQCIKDFLGHTNPQQLASMAEILCELGSICTAACDEEWREMRGGREESQWSLEFFLKATAAVIRHEGWMGRGKAREINGDGGYAQVVTATADLVLRFLSPPPEKYRTKELGEWLAAIDEKLESERAQSQAADAAQWAVNLDRGEDNDYLYNLNLIARAGNVNHKTAGLAASMIIAYRRAHDMEFETGEARKRQPRLDEWFGEEGQRTELALRVQYTREISSMFGCTVLHNMEDSEGRTFIWFCSGEGFDDGDEIYVKSTVDEHNEYKGRKQTKLTRVVEIDMTKTLAEIEKYEAKPKLTKQQRGKLERLRSEVEAREQALAKLAERSK